MKGLGGSRKKEKERRKKDRYGIINIFFSLSLSPFLPPRPRLLNAYTRIYPCTYMCISTPGRNVLLSVFPFYRPCCFYLSFFLLLFSLKLPKTERKREKGEGRRETKRRGDRRWEMREEKRK